MQSRSTRLGFAIVPVLVLACVRPASAQDQPPVFADMAYSVAVDSTKVGDKILVVKATAEWCGPCKQMDKTTWRDPGVVEWFKGHGLAIQVDVDKEPAVAKALAIEAMPTMVAFKQGKEFDRIVGYRSAEQLLGWLGDVKAGKRTADAMEEKAARVKAGGEMSVDERYKLAAELAGARKFDEATEQYVWLWKHMLETAPAMTGVRLSFMASEMQRLAARHAPAKAAFITLRDEAGARLTAKNRSRQDRTDWVVLNDVVGEEAQTLEWFDRVKDDIDGRASIAEVSHHVDRLLEKEGRWADMGRVIVNPLERMERSSKMFELDGKMEDDPRFKEHAAQFRQVRFKMFRDGAGKTYAALLAAGRDDEAAAVSAAGLKADDTGGMRAALVEWALRASQARPAQSAWLDEAKEKGEQVGSLRSLLDAALKRAP